jgi:segregation and condensation protein B
VRLWTYFRTVLDELVAEYSSAARGLEIREVAGGFRFGTKPEYHDAVRGFVKSLKPPLKLSLQALETLAVVAYKQPVTAPEISEIRGVDSSGVLGSLLSRKLITTAGRKHVIGRPILYKTTREFLLKFGLKDVAELPSIEEFEKMAGQMAEQEEIPMESEDRESPKETEERLESDGEAAAPEPVADEAIVDGRISGLPPTYDDDDPSAEEAEIQRGEA